MSPASRPELPPDPTTVRAKKAERIVVACFLIAMLAGLGFLVAYAIIGVGTITRVLHSNLALGGTLSLALLLLGIGAVIWVRHLMPDVELTEQRHPLATDPRTARRSRRRLRKARRPASLSSARWSAARLIAATVPLAVAPLFLLRDLGPLPGTSLDHTVWRKGRRLLVYGTGRPITPAEFSSPGSIISVAPEGFQDNDDAMAKAAVIIIKFRPGEIIFGEPTRFLPRWSRTGLSTTSSRTRRSARTWAARQRCMSRRRTTSCAPATSRPSTPRRDARVLFGPATRPLPQLPIGVDSQGYLIATSDFHEPVGPSFWERS